MENDCKEYNIGIRIIISQETETTSHYLFEIFNVNIFKNKTEVEIQKFLETITDLSIQLVRGLKYKKENKE